MRGLGSAVQRGVEDALASALREGRLAMAGLDMFAEDPPNPASLLLHLSDVIASPTAPPRR